jgi:ribonuclease inhibitor
MKQRWLDFSACQHPLEAHQIIREKLELPSAYGCNLDALWDALTGLMYVPAEITIVFRPKQPSETMRTCIEAIVAVFLEARDQYDEFILHAAIETGGTP